MKVSNLLQNLLSWSSGPWVYLDRFEPGLEKALNRALKKFGKRNVPYLIDIVSNKMVSFQFVHGRMIKQIPLDASFNFTISLTFGHDNQKEERFLRLDFSKNFIHYEFDGGSCYAFNFGHDVKKAIVETTIIAHEVFLFNLNNTFEFTVHDMNF